MFWDEKSGHVGSIALCGVLGYVIVSNFIRTKRNSDEGDDNWLRILRGLMSSCDLALTTKSKLPFDSKRIILPIDILPGGPSPINLDSDEVLRYYMEDIMKSPEWREDPSKVDEKDENSPDDWVPRHPALIRLTGRHPFNCEAPLKTLHNKGFITPVSLHYVRNHGPAPKSVWDNHHVDVTGLCPKPLRLSMNDLLTLFPLRSIPVTLVCCGNRRKEQNMIKQTIGFNWGAAGVSTGVWTGVRLCDILRMAGVTELKPGLHVRFASLPEKGGDKLPKGIYGTSVPLSRALDPAYDVMLAFLHNGEVLRPDHGFPVRLIVPGYIGGRMIKWVTDITIMDTESQDYFHFYDNRVLPSHVDAERAIAEDWWHKPEYICNDLNINSAIARPDHNEKLTVAPEDSSSYTLEGYAYTGGGRRITRVEASLDSGATWLVATLKVTERPTEYGKYWCWVFWELDVSLLSMKDAREIVLRAWDDGTNTQPIKPTWNVMGMLNNPWFRIKIHKQQLPGEETVTLTFEHPTLAGAQEGGWMARLKGDQSLTDPMVPHEALPTDVSDRNAVQAKPQHPEPVVSEDSPAQFDPSQPSYSLSEVRKHNTAESAWIVVRNRVYDCTPFLAAHPGGADSILLNAGTDSTDEFDAIHSKKAWKMLEEYFIGQLRPDSAEGVTEIGTTEETDSEASALSAEIDSSSQKLIALNPKQRIPFRLVKREVLSSDSLRLRFALQTPQHTLGLPVGQHMYFSAQIDGKLVMRAYTPTSSDFDIGYFDLVIKVYSPTAAFPEGGKMSQHLGRLSVGDTVDVKGPLGHVTYEGRGHLSISHSPVLVKKFSMLCGGTGITPMFQVIAAVLRDPEDTTEMFILYANRTEDDMLLRPELDAMAAAHPDRLHLRHVLSRPKLATATAGVVFGRISSEMICSFLPSGSEAGVVALLCGPQALLDDVCKPALLQHGYAKELCIYF